MKCQEIMKKQVECLSPDDTCLEAARRMRDTNVGFLPVCDENKKVLGTITDRDMVIRLIAERQDFNTSVKDVMTREVVACRPSEDLSRAEELMGRYQKSRIMCVDDQGFLVGVISLSDIARVEDAGRLKDTWSRVADRELRA